MPTRASPHLLAASLPLSLPYYLVLSIRSLQGHRTPICTTNTPHPSRSSLAPTCIIPSLAAADCDFAWSIVQPTDTTQGDTGSTAREERQNKNNIAPTPTHPSAHSPTHTAAPTGQEGIRLPHPRPTALASTAESSQKRRHNTRDHTHQDDHTHDHTSQHLHSPLSHLHIHPFSPHLCSATAAAAAAVVALLLLLLRPLRLQLAASDFERSGQPWSPVAIYYMRILPLIRVCTRRERGQRREWLAGATKMVRFRSRSVKQMQRTRGTGGQKGNEQGHKREDKHAFNSACLFSVTVFSL